MTCTYRTPQKLKDTNIDNYACMIGMPIYLRAAEASRGGLKASSACAMKKMAH